MLLIFSLQAMGTIFSLLCFKKCQVFESGFPIIKGGEVLNAEAEE
jgi:hypothetical protein